MWVDSVAAITAAFLVGTAKVGYAQGSVTWDPGQNGAHEFTNRSARPR